MIHHRDGCIIQMANNVQFYVLFQHITILFLHGDVAGWLSLVNGDVVFCEHELVPYGGCCFDSPR